MVTKGLFSRSKDAFGTERKERLFSSRVQGTVFRRIRYPKKFQSSAKSTRESETCSDASFNMGAG